MNKEEIYDEKIAPLMTQIIGVCKEHGIAMICSFAIPIPDDEGLRCTTHLPDGDGAFDAKCRAAFDIIRSYQPQPFHFMTENQDGSKVLTAVIG